MFNSVQKAIVSIIMGVIFLINYFTSLNITIEEDMIASVVNGLVAIINSTVGPWLVWRVPNQDQEEP